jgi:cytochrome c biogenesis protein CcdA
VISLLIEGIESLRLPCSWVLLIPGIAITVFGRRRTPLVVATFALAAMVVAWLRFAGWWFAVPSGAVQILLGFAIIVSAGVAWRLDRGAFDIIAAAIAGIAAAWTWIPCVGPHLGEVLNGSRMDPFEHIGGTIAFLAGQFLPFILVAAVGVAAPGLQQRSEHRAVIAGGAVLLALVGLLFVTRLFDDIASELARRSTF